MAIVVAATALIVTAAAVRLHGLAELDLFCDGRLDACDEFVRGHGILILSSAPIAGFTDPANPLGYALYHLAGPDGRQ